MHAVQPGLQLPWGQTESRYWGVLRTDFWQAPEVSPAYRPTDCLPITPVAFTAQQHKAPAAARLRGCAFMHHWRSVRDLRRHMNGQTWRHRAQRQLTAVCVPPTGTMHSPTWVMEDFVLVGGLVDTAAPAALASYRDNARLLSPPIATALDCARFSSSLCLAALAFGRNGAWRDYGERLSCAAPVLSPRAVRLSGFG